MERQVHAMYFSATGTTEKVVTAVADHIARTWNGTAALRFDFTPPAMSCLMPWLFADV